LSFFISHDQSDQFNFKLDWKQEKCRNCQRNMNSMEDLKLTENEAKKKAKEAEELKKKDGEIENEAKLRSKEWKEAENEAKLKDEEFQKTI
jgi:hypothetical protein